MAPWRIWLGYAVIAGCWALVIGVGVREWLLWRAERREREGLSHVLTATGALRRNEKR